MFQKFKLALFLFLDLQSQNKFITLESDGKIKKISLDHSHKLVLLTSQFCEKDQAGYQQFLGTGLESSSGNIVIKPIRQWVSYKDHFKLEEKIVTYTDSVLPITFSLDPIIRLDYQSSSRKFFYNTGMTMMIVGWITTLVVAPLISLKSKSQFNAARYYTTAGIGLLAIGISIPLASVKEYKKYAFTNSGNEEQRIWRPVHP